jgi:hypothetical protein
MPGVDYFFWCIDKLASRYGWTKKYCEEEFYWEEFYALVQMAANFSADEKNADLKFNFMLHADKKSAGKWRDIPIPFPVDENITGFKSDGISQLPQNLKESIVYRED